MGVETRRTAAGNRHKKSNPPILSHEFVIQNHGDIMSCVLMVFIVGIMFPVSLASHILHNIPLSASSNMCLGFIVPQYNETTEIPVEGGTTSLTLYTNGLKDLCAIAFYTIAWIVIHAVIQEYGLDKFQRKVHLSKVKTFKFTESGHQVIFAIYSTIHAAYVLLEFLNNHSDVKRIWENYPEEHRWMTLHMKIFYIFQIAYWLHQYPEFYFQKFKKDEMRQRGLVSLFYIAFIGAAYVLNFVRVGVALLFLEYLAQSIFHAARLAHFLEKKNISKPAFKAWNIVFLVVRLASAVLTVTTFWYGLRQSETAYVSIASGNFNTTFIRLNCMLLVLGLQLFQLWNFVNFHIGRFKESNKKKEKKPFIAPPKKTRNTDSEGDSEEVSKKSADRKKKN